MVEPNVVARMEEDDDLTRSRVDTREIWPFEQIALLARQRQVVGRVVATMLLSDNVLDVERTERQRRLWQMAVLATMLRPLAHRVPQLGAP